MMKNSIGDDLLVRGYAIKKKPDTASRLGLLKCAVCYGRFIWQLVGVLET